MGPGSEDDRHAWEREGAHRVASGVHRIPLPLPGDGLKAVNVYVIAQRGGIVLIDSGWALGRAEERLDAALRTLDHDVGSITRILVTHVHRDHYELGILLRRRFGTRLDLGAGERPSLEGLLFGDGDRPLTERLRRAGAEPLLRLLDRRRKDEEASHSIEWELPDHWLADTEVVELDGRRLEVLATPGHTRGHVVFVDRAAGLLFAGDHVLPHITPSIGFENLPTPSPLADYLASLALVRGLPDLRLLPAHGPVRPTTHDRIDALLVHHEQRLDASADAVGQGRSDAYEVAAALTWTRRERPFDQLDPFNQMLAVNETAAHLDVLVERSRLGIEIVDGVRHYRA